MTKKNVRLLCQISVALMLLILGIAFAPFVLILVSGFCIMVASAFGLIKVLKIEPTEQNSSDWIMYLSILGIFFAVGAAVFYLGFVLII